MRAAPRASRIRLLVLDVDGVLTDGGLLFSASGEEAKRFHVHDGLAMVAARQAGLQVAILSSRASAAVTRRMAELGVGEVHQGVTDKAGGLDDAPGAARIGPRRGRDDGRRPPGSARDGPRRPGAGARQRRG